MDNNYQALIDSIIERQRKRDNMSNSSTTKSGGIGFCGLLTIVFITLKLTNCITWSWWWVLSPLWIPVVAVIIIGLLCGLIFVVLNR